LSAADGRDVSAGTGAEDDDVIVGHEGYPSPAGWPSQPIVGRAIHSK